MASENQAHGIMVIWHDVASGFVDDYLNWHTCEHMPERIAIPGFLRGRRGHSPESPLHPYITLYESDDAGTFGSPEYFARLNTPTAWSQRLHRRITNFIRGACEIIVSRGVGLSAHTLSVRVGLGSKSGEEVPAIATSICEYAASLPRVTNVRFGLSRQDISNAKNREAELRGTQGAAFDAVLFVDSYDRAALAGQKPALLDEIRAAGLTVGEDDHAIYDLHYAISCREPAAAREIVRQMAPDSESTPEGAP
jgi:hypothetical protein